MINSLPSPCPTLQRGKAIGSSENAGFTTMWNWIVDFFQNIKKYITVGINNRTGNIYLVAGKGIDVSTSGNKITISVGAGKTEDDSGPTPNGDGDGDGDWYPPGPVEDGEIDFGGGSGGMFAWDASSATMGPGGVMIGRQWVNASGTGSGKGDALYQVKCTINANGSYSCQVVSGVSLGQAPTTTQCWIPIYQISGGKIAADYRGAFVVPAYE